MAEESPSSFDYFPLAHDASTGGVNTAAATNNGGGETIILSPVPYRDEACLHNDNSERIYFDEDTFGTADDDQDNTNTITASLLPTTTNNNNNNTSNIRQRQPSQLSGLNYLNAITYAAHLFVSWGIGIWGLDGIVDTRWEISTRYETLVTPAHYSFYVWAPILVLEGLFSVAQLTPYYRARPIVTAGTSFYFFYTFLIQTLWTFCFAFQVFVFSFIAVLGALVSLVSLLASQKRALQGARQGMLQYCLFSLPFYLHTGWMVLMTVDHFSLLARAEESSISVQLAADIASLGILLAVATACCLGGPAWRDFVIPTVILWSLIGIAWRLHDPTDAMMELYGPVAIHAILYSTYMFAGLVGCMLIPNIVVWACREFCTIDVVEFDG